MTGQSRKILLLGAALAGPLLAPAMATPAWGQTGGGQAGGAQAGGAQAGATRMAVLDVPAGPLETVLLAVGRQAGLHFAYDSSLTAGRRSAGVRGTRAPEQAVAQALAGTGLRHAFTAPSEVTIWAASTTAATTAPPGTVVLDQVTLPAGSSQIEGSGLYSFDAPTTTATGLALTPRETPQAISVITDQQIRDSGAQALKDTLNQTPGVSTASQYGDARWAYYARGSRISNLQFDGISQPAAWWAQEGSADDMTIYDHVEVVRGATGLKEGPGNPAASVNLVRKRPLADARTRLDVTARDHGTASIALDRSQPLNASGTLRGRLLAYGLTGDTWRDAQSRKSGLIHGALDIDLDADTRLGLGLSYQSDSIDGYS